MQRKYLAARGAATLLILAGLFAPSIALGTVPQRLMIDLIASAATANVGDSALASQNRALVHLQIVDADGMPVDTLAPPTNLGSGDEFIEFPDGWTMDTLQVGAGGCGLGLTRFKNLGEGLYQLSVMGYSADSACAWRAGIYVIRIVVESDGYFGIALASFEVR